MNKNVLIFFSIVLFVFNSISGLAQQPAYFILGENQFRGVHIYDVIQDKELNYWFATDQGIYHFDHYKYSKIECKEAKGDAVFNFVIDSRGAIFCHNLNNQVFKIQNRQCKLVYEIKSNEVSPDISLSIADDDNLLIVARNVIVINANGETLSRYNAKQRYLGSPFTTDTQAVQFHLGGSDSILFYSKATFFKQKLNVDDARLNKESVLKFFNVNDSLYAIDSKFKNIYRFSPSHFRMQPISKNSLFERSQSVRMYQTNQSVWVAGTLPGVAFIDKEIEKGSLFYEDYFISDVYKDNEGNILLSTFDKGVLVIPDLNIPDVIHNFGDNPISSLYADSPLGLILGSSNGQLINYINGNLYMLDAKGNRPIESIYGNKEGDLLLFDNGHIRVHDTNSSRTTDIVSASLKAAVFVTSREFYIGTNRGILHGTWNDNANFSLQPLPGPGYRIIHMVYDAKNKHLYASTAKGLLLISLSDSSRVIQYEGADIFPNHLHASNGKIFATTRNSGILIVENGQVTGAIRPTINGKEEAIKKMIVHGHTIIANSINGLFQFNLEGKLLRSIHSNFGFAPNGIKDFIFLNNRLWVSHSGGVQQIDLEYKKENNVTPLIRFDNIIVNEQSVNQSGDSNFKSDQRKIQFIISSPTLRNRETTFYHYKLIGYDTDWNINSYEFNEITYNALAPGAYTMQVKADDHGNFSNIASYSFSIAHPFYVRWWFVALVIASFLLLVFGVYRWQIGLLRKKSQQLVELNNAKLTAIQSQMNPHFIFNSLNSIQDLVLKGDVENSYSYITTFSNLVRRTLSYSDKDFIDFGQEIKLLEIYLSLENLRYKGDFSYQINTNGVEEIMLPPLLVQPFIENALIHGLLHKEGDKRLTITFELRELLTCTIEDNGIGRKQSKAIKERQRKDHESFSGKAIRKRFDILSSVFKGMFGYTYQDLYEGDKPMGTKVTLTIPVKHRF